LKILEKFRVRKDIQEQENNLKEKVMDISALKELVIDGNNLFFADKKVRSIMLGINKSKKKAQEMITELTIELGNLYKNLESIVLVFDGHGENRAINK
jgi:hypothetical protein